MTYTLSTVPEQGEAISFANGVLRVPAHPIIPYIEGDGIGADIWPAARSVLDAAVQAAYGWRRRIEWMEVFAGKKFAQVFNTWLPEETLQAFKEFRVGIKGPLETPVGGGMRSLNVALRRELDLYTCLRPVRWFQGVPSPVRHPESVDMVIFRENTEDLYAGIEYEDGSAENLLFKTCLKSTSPKITPACASPKPAGSASSPSPGRARSGWCGRRSNGRWLTSAAA